MDVEKYKGEWNGGRDCGMASPKSHYDRIGEPVALWVKFTEIGAGACGKS